MRRWTWIALLAGCSEYALNGPKETSAGTTPSGTETETETTSVTDTTSPLDEACDGIDNDGDGLVDEDFPDTDADGIPDCLDESCVPELGVAGSVTVLTECEPYDPAIVKDPWNVRLEWSFTAPDQIVVSPVTGQLTDDNGDGVIDDLDIPDVAMTSWTNGRLYLAHGDGSGQICFQDGWRTDGGVIIADVDGDGQNEVVGPMADGRVRAVDGACNTEWTSAQSYGFLYPVTTAADLDADGDVEVIADVAVVTGASGAHLGTLGPANIGCWRTPMTGDIDQDGDVEIILGDSVFDSNGTRLWNVTGSGSSCFNALANLDADVQAEVLFSYGTTLSAREHDGTPIWTASLAVSNPGPPCAGDIDGDGEVEIIAPNGTRLSTFEHDGTPKWTAFMQDSSGAAGCAVFDMNGDEIYEVLFADEVALRLYDGSTGAVLWEAQQHDSVTYFETPTVADVDNDGSAEMLVVNSGGGSVRGLTVFGHDGSGWPESGSTWGLHDFSATNQNADGSIPQNPVAPWLEYNICRGRPYDDVPGQPNLWPSVVDVCVSSCDPAIGTVSVSYQVASDGGVDSAETTVALYLVDPAGAEVLFGTQVVPVAASGELLAGGVFDVPLSMWTGEVVLRTDDDGALVGVVDECHEDDNEASWSGEVCGATTP